MQELPRKVAAGCWESNAFEDGLLMRDSAGTKPPKAVPFSAHREVVQDICLGCTASFAVHPRTFFKDSHKLGLPVEE
jgi:hypothetical protein